jgi:hypothetical protein
MSKYAFMQAYATEDGRIVNKYSEIWQIKDNSFPGKAYGVFEKGKRVMVVSSGVFQKMKEDKVLSLVEDATPTWLGILDLYLTAYVSNPDRSSAAYKELVNMAQTADKYNELVKKLEHAK